MATGTEGINKTKLIYEREIIKSVAEEAIKKILPEGTCMK